jgi:hypothetical protein
LRERRLGQSPVIADLQLFSLLAGHKIDSAPLGLSRRYFASPTRGAPHPPPRTQRAADPTAALSFFPTQRKPPRSTSRGRQGYGLILREAAAAAPLLTRLTPASQLVFPRASGQQRTAIAEIIRTPNR